MGIYLYAYILSLLVSFFAGWSVWKQQKNLSGLFFLLFTIFLSIWFILYFIFFAGILHPDYLLILSRLSFATSIITVYSLLFFIIFFGIEYTTKMLLKVLLIGGFFLFVIFFYIGTDDIILRLEYNVIDKAYREVTGALFFLHIVLHSTFLILFISYSYKILKNLDTLNKIRLKNIVFSTFVLFITLIILQLILPYFGIWILEKEIVFLFTAFVIFVPLTIRRYYFTHFGYGIGKILGHASAFGLAILLNYGLQYTIALLHDTQSGMSYWFGSYEWGIIDIISIIVLYYVLHYLVRTFFLGNDTSFYLHAKLQKLKKSISLVNNVKELNILLKNEMQFIFTAQSGYIYLYNTRNQKFYNEIKSFFKDNSREKVFINDIVFIQKYKHLLSEDIFSKIDTKDLFLAYPIYNTNGINIGIFVLGAKRFGDFYTLDEITLLEEFTFFLEIHLKYIRTYDDLQDLTLNLDKKVDEKTIDYNNLINRQKEFIAMISHEVRSPMSAAIFQGESLIEELDKSDFSKEKFKENLRMLSAQLIRMGGIISKLFSVQYYENNSVNLFRERIQFVQFLEYEIDLFAHVHDDVTIIADIDKEIGFLKIDKIQFQQVLTNLLDNAIKFIPSEDPIISVQAHKHEQGVEIRIEDNGRGFEGINIDKLFDIYTTGTNKNIGLGMGLYLCKKIVSMHSGTIKASISKKYGGACFTIFLPTLSKR